LDQLVKVYQQSEDFLALGPVPHASREMVLTDLDLSRRAGGIYCGIFDDQNQLVGVLDYVPRNFVNDRGLAFIELLMVALPYRRLGLGAEVLAEVERLIWHDLEIKEIRLAVQVNNPLGMHFWQRNGFTIISGPQNQPDGTTVYYLSKARR
jgi:ribosomal protein S18 acetylase RimI-like enzyme